jgi:hypothetical protein
MIDGGEEGRHTEWDRARCSHDRPAPSAATLFNLSPPSLEAIARVHCGVPAPSYFARNR